jgi:hypothetical protein
MDLRETRGSSPSGRPGLEPDVSYWVIWMLARLGLAWNVKLPTLQAQRQRPRTA